MCKISVLVSVFLIYYAKMDNFIPENILQQANDVVDDILPDKSRENYERTYKKFVEWKEGEKIGTNNFTETVLLAYFGKLSSMNM